MRLRGNFNSFPGMASFGFQNLLIISDPEGTFQGFGNKVNFPAKINLEIHFYEEIKTN